MDSAPLDYVLAFVDKGRMEFNGNERDEIIRHILLFHLVKNSLGIMRMADAFGV